MVTTIASAGTAASAPKEKAAGFQNAHRAQMSFLAPLEKKTLAWLAARTPASIHSDHLTALGLISLLLAGIAYWASRYQPLALWAVVGLLALNWLGDSLDGTLARFRNRQRPRYGFYVDHVVDMFGTFFLLGGLGLSGYMNLPVAIGLIVAYYMLNIEVYLTTYTIGTFHISFWRFSPTELRILLAVGSLVLLARGGWVVIAGEQYRLFDIGGMVGIAGMIAMLLAAVYRHTTQLYQEERLS
jgi:phosphatidylglycerophosphate synthase